MRGGLISGDAVSLSFGRWACICIATLPVIASFIPLVFMRVVQVARVALVQLSSPIVAVLCMELK